MKWLTLFICVIASLLGTSSGRPLSGSEAAAVGDALTKALGVMSGKVKADDKFSICMRMFPNGPPADAATSATWQSCKEELPSSQVALLLRGSRSQAAVNPH
mmetsp:Transcript_13172/g.30006  ORF Transcript_13172/g.30006 Transcript_13172/m.30006 type:complete len:102 (+) Transcript_13172:83-388(+)